jgi:hypothetical protein
MAFAPQCINASTKPVLYLVDSLVGTDDRTASKLSDFPQLVLTSFDTTLDATLQLMIMRKIQQPPTTLGTPLFVKKRVTSLADIPSVVNIGDIVVLYDYTPPYNLATGGVIAWPPVSEENKIVSLQKDRAYKVFQTRFNAKALDTKFKDQPLSKREEVGDAGGASTHQLMKGRAQFKSGGKKRWYHWAAFGVVNIAGPITKALYTFKKAQEPTQPLLDLLTKGNFGVEAVKTISDRRGVTTNEYLKAVGRGLAYVTLHEFWHMTDPTSTPENPHSRGEGNLIIEGSADASDVHKQDTALPLTLMPESVTSILKFYNDEWCGNLKDGGLNANQF